MLKSDQPKAIEDIKLDEWLVLHSDLDLSQTFVICEIIINVFEKKNDDLSPRDNIGLGIIAV